MIIENKLLQKLEKTYKPSKKVREILDKYQVSETDLDWEHDILPNVKDYSSEKVFIDEFLLPKIKALSQSDKTELLAIDIPPKAELQYIMEERQQEELLEHQKKVDEEYKEILQNIKTTPTPAIDKLVWKLRKWLDLVLNEKAETHTLFIQGRAGCGKTYQITKILKEKFGIEKLSKFKMGGHKTPLDYYCAIYDNPDGIFYWNDLNKSFFLSSTGISLLKQSSDTQKDRKVDYGSTTGKLGNRLPYCIFRGKQIFDMNTIPRNEEFHSIISRSPPIKFNPTNKEIVIMSYEIIKENFVDIPLKEKIGIVGFLERNVSDATKNFDLRTLKWVIDIYRECGGINDMFIKMANDLLEVDEDKELVLELSKTKSTITEMEKSFIEQTHKSRATFYSLRNELKLTSPYTKR